MERAQILESNLSFVLFFKIFKLNLTISEKEGEREGDVREKP